jgi:DNA-binding NtrC family response regulator
MPRILLVEDDRDVRLLLEHVLIDGGHEVDATGTMAEGKRLLETCRYDVVVADVRLPDGTGMDLCDAAAQHDIKTVIVTGYAFTLPAGVAERYNVLLKPIRPTEIISAIERVLRD